MRNQQFLVCLQVRGSLQDGQEARGPGGQEGAGLTILKASWTFLDHLGAILAPLEAIYVYIGAFLGTFWPILGPSRAILGPSCANLGPFWSHLKPSWTISGAILAYLRPSWVLMGFLRSFWSVLGLSLAILGPS